MSEIPNWVKERFPAERRAAVDFFRLRITDSMLRKIAEADYGQQADQHWDALLPLRDGQDWSEFHYWFPMEVLELYRFLAPEITDCKPGSDGLRDHQIRAFCCAVLLVTSNFESDHLTLARGLCSAFAIGGGATAAMAKFLLWKIPLLNAYDDNPFFALALATSALSETPEVSPANETLLVDWLAMTEGSYEGSERLIDLPSDPLKEWKPIIFKIHREWPDRPLSNYLREFGIE